MKEDELCNKEDAQKIRDWCLACLKADPSMGRQTHFSNIITQIDLLFPNLKK